MDESLESRLTQHIKSHYGDLKSFSAVADIPSSTLYSMFQRGIFNSSISNVIQMSKALHISVDALADGEIRPSYSDKTSLDLTSDEETLITGYRRLTPPGKEYVQQSLALALQSYSEKITLFPSWKQRCE